MLFLFLDRKYNKLRGAQYLKNENMQYHDKGLVTMTDLEEFRTKLHTRYMSEFDGFWRWKIKIETEGEHILDDNYRDQACSKLWSALRGWQAYRPCDSNVCLRVLKGALKNMADSYNQIRNYSLLEFDRVPNKPLNVIWHELGRVKEIDGRKNEHGYYYIVSLTKHLMFLWGQTPAFDSKVRTRMPSSFNISRYNQWPFEEWKRVLADIQKNLTQEPEVVATFKEESQKRYGTESIVPYGRFLDMYYHQAPETHEKKG